MKLMDVKSIADEILDEIAEKRDKQKALLILHAGDDPASAAYMKGKAHDCERCGFPWMSVRVHDQEDLMDMIRNANEDQAIGGIIVQLPLPKGFDKTAAVMAVAPQKDVDGFRPDSPFQPCTPEGVIDLMRRRFGRLNGLDVMLIGKGELVGWPLIKLLLDEHCTPLICHSESKGVKHKLLQRHDVVITATGCGGLVDLMDVNADLIIDATIVRGQDGRLHGDCFDFDSVENRGLTVTPVPGGVGLMTRAMLMRHMLEVQG